MDSAGFALWKSPLALGPVLFTGVFAYRSFVPMFDGIITAVTAGLIGVVTFMFVGQRWAGLAFLVFPVAVFTSPAGREFSFNLTAVDSPVWKWHSAIGLLSLGVSTLAAGFVAMGRPPRPIQLAGTLASGLGFGGVMIWTISALYPHPGFGRNVPTSALKSLPEIELLNYAYEYPDLRVAEGATFTAKVTNRTNLPHSLTIESLGIDVYIPAGRYSVVEITPEQLQSIETKLSMYCTIGEHRSLGMARTLDIAVDRR